MLLILIPIVWLAILSLLVAVCRVAAEGDAALASQRRAPASPLGASPLGARLTLSRTPSMQLTRTRRAHGHGSLTAAAVPTRLRRAAIHAGRQH